MNLQEFITIPTEIIGELPRGKPFANEQAYIDLIQMADENGEIITSERKLMNRWSWGNNKVRRFLELLEKQSTCESVVKQSRSTKILINTSFMSGSQSDKKAIKKQSESSREEEKPKEDTEIYKRIIGYLNMVCGTDYKHTAKATRESIHARLEDGYTEDDFKTVIDKKFTEWKGTEWEKYLRPQTLFRPSNFEGYLNQKVVKGRKQGEIDILDEWRNS